MLFWMAWLVLRLLRGGKLVLRPSLLVAPLLVFLVLVCLSTMFSYEPRLSWGRMRTVSLLFVAVLVSQIPRSYKEIKLLVGVLLFAVAVNLGHTAWQYTYGTGVKLTNLSTAGPLARVGLIRDDVVQAVNHKRVHSTGQLLREVNQGSPSDLLEVQIARGAPAEHWALRVERGALSELSAPGATGRGRPVRAQGFFRHYIPYAEFLALFGTLAFAFAVAYRHHSRWVKVAFAALVVTVVTALIFTATRAALGALLLAGFAALSARAGKIPRLVGIGTAVVIVIVALVWFQQARGTWGSQDAGTHYRTLMWADGVRLVRQHPWLGVGMDSVHHHWNEWGIRAYQQYPHLKSHFHSSYIQLAVECGVPALVAWLWFLGSFLWMGYKLFKQPVSDAFLDAFGLAALGSAIAFTALGVLHNVFGDSEAMMLFWLIVGLSWWVYSYRSKTIESSVLAPSRTNVNER
ncbi:MAG: O-antigen ligase family protein [Acidobacteriales bacterium]|nr:O-antigen ligase family protein [Terriglobales bacterium]